MIAAPCSKESTRLSPSSRTLPDRPRLLLVEDDDGLRRSLQLMLYNQGFEVRAYPSAAQALADQSVTDAAMLVADYRLPDSDGIALLRELRSRGWTGRAVLVTGFPAPHLKIEADRVGYATVLEKPVPQHRLLAAVGPATPLA